MEPQTPLEQPKTADPLNSIQPQVADPLASLPSPGVTPMDVADQEAVKRRSSMYSMGKLAEAPLVDGDGPDLWDTYSATRQAYQDVINIMGDEQIRKEAETQALIRDVNGLTSMANNAVDPEQGKMARIALAKKVQETAFADAKVEAEKQWAESIALLRDNGEDVEAELKTIQHNTPDVFDSMVDTQTIRAMIMRKIEDSGRDTKDRNWLFWATDALMYMLPFGTTAAHTNTFEVKQGELFDFMMTGRRFNEETNNFWNAARNAKTNDEKQAIVDHVWANVDRNVNTMFGPNEILRLQIMHAYNVTPTADEINIWDALQNLPTVATIGYKSFTTPFKFSRALQGFGADAKAASIVEDVAKIMQTEGAEAAMKKYGITLEEVQDMLVPSAMNPKSAVRINKYETPRTIELEAKIQENFKTMEELRKNLTPLNKKSYEALLDETDAMRKEIAAHINKVDTAALKVTPAADPNRLPLLTADRLGRGQSLFEKMMGGQLQHVSRLSDAEKAEVLKDLTERAKYFGVSRKNPRIVIDQEMVPEVAANGSEFMRVTMTVGKTNKKGKSPWYVSEAKANQHVASIGASDAKAVEVSPGQWGIKLSMPVDETGKSLGGARFYMPLADKQKAGPFSWWAKYISGGNIGGSDELKGLAQISFDKRNKINAHVRKEMLPVFFKLSKEQKDLLGSVLAKGELEETWYDSTQLEVFYKANFGQAARDFKKFQDAYEMAVDINDMEYFLRNSSIRLEASTQGKEFLNFVGLPLNKSEIGKVGKIFRNISDVPDEVIWDMTEGYARVKTTGASPTKGKYSKDTRLGLEDISKRLASGQDAEVLVRFDEPVTMGPDKAKVRFFIVKTSQLDVQPLPYQMLPYRAGGHRMYQANYFVKKAVEGKQPWGEAYLDSPFTPTASLTLREAQEWSTAMNSVQAAYTTAKDGKLTGDALEAAVEAALGKAPKDLGFPPADEFIKWMDEYGSKHPFEAVFDRELPSHYSGRASFAAGDSWGDDLSGTNTYMQTQGRMYISSKGPILRNIRDWSKTAEVYDPWTTLNTAMTQISKLSSFSDFKIKAIQKWISTYGHALDSSLIEGKSPMKLFLEGQFRTGTKDLQSIKAAAELQRSYIKRILGWKSDFDLGVEGSIRKAMEWISTDLADVAEKAAPGVVTTKGKTAWAKGVHGIYNWVEEVNPINAAMGLAFDATMGFFNISQYPLQIQTSLAAASIDPAKGMQAMANLPWMHLYMRKAGDQATLDWLISRGAHTAAGFKDPKDYIAMMETLKRSGFTDNMLGAIKNEFGPNAALGMLGKGMEDFRRSGRIFTNIAEEHNRMNAWQMAWRTIREKYPEMNTSSPLFVERVRKLAGSFSLNMDEAGAAAWQRNSLARIPTQFMPYMFRWHEVLLDGNLTVAQRVKFVAGQAFLYGSAGLPFAAWYFAEQEKNSGQTPKMGTLAGIVDRGFADTLIWYATGQDIAFSDRAGIGAYPTDIIQEFFGGGRFGETSAADMLSGASGQIWGQFLDSSFKAMWYAAMESGGDSGYPLTTQSIERAARSVSTLNNILKAEAVFNYGQYTNRKGQPILDGMPSEYGFAALLGMTPAQVQEQTAQMGYLGKRSERVKEWTEQVMIQRTQYGQAIKDGRYDEAEQIAKDVNFISRYLIPRDIKEDVMRKAFQDPRTRTVAENIAERYEKEKQTEFRKVTN